MILKNAWGKYDMIWAIGDIRLKSNPDYSIEKVQDSITYEAAKTYYSHSESASGFSVFRKIVYSVLDDHIKNGVQTLTPVELAIQYCIHAGLFDKEYPKNQIAAYIGKIKKMVDEKDERVIFFEDLLALIGDDFDNIPEHGMNYIESIVYENLIFEHLAPKYMLPFEEIRINFKREFYHHLRFAVTSLIQMGAFEEILHENQQ